MIVSTSNPLMGRLSDHEALADSASSPPSALLAANGVKVSIMLEEIGLPYEPHTIDTGKNETRTPEFLSLNPDGKIPNDTRSRWSGRPAADTIRIWCDLGLSRREDRQAALRRSGQADRDNPVGVLPDCGGRTNVRPVERYRAEAQRLLTVLETRLDRHSWIMGDEYSIADISLLGWVRHLVGFYGAGELVGYANLKSVPSWLERVRARPAVERGLSIPARPG
jgi:GST-like protein